MARLQRHPPVGDEALLATLKRCAPHNQPIGINLQGGGLIAAAGLNLYVDVDE
jgi:hypothetical protein